MTSIERRFSFLSLIAFSLFIAAILSFSIRRSSAQLLTVGAKNCTEGHILSEIIAQCIEQQTKLAVQRNFSLEGTFVTFHALKAGDIDLYVEYTGSAYSTILKRDVCGKGGEEMQAELKEVFTNQYGLTWLEPLGFQNTYALMVAPLTAEKYQLYTLSDLRRVVQKEKKEVRIGLDPEFYGRKEREIIEKKYAIPLEGLTLMDHTLLYLTLEKGGIEVINGYSTDGLAEGLVLLQDDQQFFPAYDAIPIMRTELIKKFPQLRKIFQRLGGLFSLQEVQMMNYAVEKKGESVYDVAYAFLNRHHLTHESSTTSH